MECENCGTPIEPSRSHNKKQGHYFCCDLCRVKAWNRNHPRMYVKSKTNTQTENDGADQTDTNSAGRQRHAPKKEGARSR
jgi:hypothetical protein